MVIEVSIVTLFKFVGPATKLEVASFKVKPSSVPLLLFPLKSASDAIEELFPFAIPSLHL